MGHRGCAVNNKNGWSMGAGILTVTGCVNVVESSRSDRDLCIKKREAGGVASEVAALECLQLARVPIAGNVGKERA